MGFFTKYLELCSEKGVKPSTAAVQMGLSKSSVTRWRNGSTPDTETLNVIAAYFGVSTDYLLDNTTIKNPPNQQEPEDIAKVALFGGDSEVTPEMWQEVKDFVEYVKAKHKKGS